MSVDEVIDFEVKLYVSLCEKASHHDDGEVLYKKAAHKLFYHIQELRSTKKSLARNLFLSDF